MRVSVLRWLPALWLGAAPASAAEPPAQGTVVLEMPAARAMHYGVATPSDLLVVPRQRLSRNGERGGDRCSRDHCLVEQVSPAEVLTFVSDASDQAQVRFLPPAPIPAPLELGEAVPFRLAPVAPDDPRGAVYDVTFTLDAPRRVALDWRGDTEDGHRPHFAYISLFGPQGATSAETMKTFSEEPSRHAHQWVLPAGRFVARIRPFHRDDECTFEPPFPRPSWCALPPPTGPITGSITWAESTAVPAALAPPTSTAEAVDTVLTQPVDITAHVPPAPATHRFERTPGRDAIVRYRPAETPLSVRARPDASHRAAGVCEAGVCRVDAPGADQVIVALDAGDQARRVEVWLDERPRPEPAFTITPGQVATTFTQAPSPEDPRGAMLDFLVRVAQPGTIRVSMAWEPTDREPQLIALSEGAGLSRSDLDVVYTIEDPSAPHTVYGEVWDVHQAGSYRFRIQSCLGCDGQDLEVDVQ